jgi:hypothetical protein
MKVEQERQRGVIAAGFALWMTFGEGQLRAADLERGEARKRPCNHIRAQDSQERHRKEDAGSDDVAEASRLRGVSEIDRAWPISEEDAEKQPNTREPIQSCMRN